MPRTLLLFLGFIFSFLPNCAFEGETEVSCVLLESCVLPCSFDPGPDPVIHWFKEPDRTPVHSYSQGQNQLQHQHQNFTGRTSLFEKEFSTGNSSLLLSEVRVQDEGRYKCFTSTAAKYSSRATSVTLRVSAPVLQVALQQEAEQLLCRSEGGFPKPSVSWTPSSAAETTFKSSESGVWSVLSSVSLPHSPPHEYSCNVSTPHSWRSATYRTNSVMRYLDVVVIPCTDPRTPVKSLIWRFNHSQTIVTRSGPEPVYTESWRQFVEGLTESNGLVLKGLTKDQQGLFSCELSTEHETHVTVTEVTEVTEVTVIQKFCLPVAASVGGPLLLLLILCVVLLIRKHLKVQTRSEVKAEASAAEPEPAQRQEQEPLELIVLRKCESEDSIPDSIESESSDASRDELNVCDDSSGYGHSFTDRAFDF